MSSKVKLVDPQQITSAAPTLLDTDWTRCVICQEDKGEKLNCPAESKRPNVGAGYISLAEDLTSFDNAQARSQGRFLGVTCNPPFKLMIFMND